MIKLIKKIDWKKVLFSYYWLLVILVLVDQGSKALFLHLEASQGPGFNLEVIPQFFYLTYVRNTGAAWSLLENSPIILVLISLVATGLMFTYRILRRSKLSHLHKALWALIIAGTFGNLIDRAFYQLWTGTPGVVDFLHFRFGSYDFPVFNIADMCLVIGMIALLIVTFIEDQQQSKVSAKTAEESMNNQTSEGDHEQK